MSASSKAGADPTAQTAAAGSSGSLRSIAQSSGTTLTPRDIAPQGGSSTIAGNASGGSTAVEVPRSNGSSGALVPNTDLMMHTL